MYFYKLSVNLKKKNCKASFKLACYSVDLVGTIIPFIYLT